MADVGLQGAPQYDIAQHDASHSVSVAEQVRLVAGLRWRLLRNKLRQKHNRLDLIGLALAGIFGAVLVAGVSFGAYAGAHEFILRGHVAWMPLLFWAIFAWWQVFPLFAAGFGSSFEFRGLLRFPVSIPAFYLISLAYGVADFSSLAAIVWLAAMTLGVSTAKPELLPFMLLACLPFVFLNVTLERLIGSWLERLLARRKSRELFFAIFILCMVSLQFISPLVERYGRAAAPIGERFLPYLAPLPGSLAGNAIAYAATGAIGRSFVAIGGLVLYLAALSLLLWRRYSAQYRGEELSETSSPARRARPASGVSNEGKDNLRFIPAGVAEVLRKEFRYFFRNGYSFVLLILPPMMILLFTMQNSHHSRVVSPFGVSRGMLFPGIMAYLILGTMAPAYNCFAYEGRGVQTYFVAPVRFRQIFLGKNLMLAGVIALEVVLSIAVFALRVGLPPAPLLTATLLAIVFTVTGQFAIANWSSLSFPRKLAFGQMRGQRQSGMAVLVAFGAQIILGGISGLLFAIGGWTGNRWLPAEAFTILAAGAVAGYIASLDALSDFAEKKKETLIEALSR